MFHLEFSKMLTSETLTMNYKIIEEFWKPDMDFLLQKLIDSLRNIGRGTQYQRL